jgi:hypothetical protein
MKTQPKAYRPSSKHNLLSVMKADTLDLARLLDVDEASAEGMEPLPIKH